MRNLIIGMGEIGKGLYEVVSKVHETYTYDSAKGVNFPVDAVGSAILNICIPGNLPDFVDIVEEYIYRVCPLTTIIHSTVPLFTTQKIANRTGTDVVHSPVRGIHPHMAKGILTYVKYLGGENCSLAADFLIRAGIKVCTVDDALTSELAKVLSTTRYGINLMFARFTFLLCEQFGLDYGQVYTNWEEQYNAGLKELDLSKYTRPVLDAPGEKIGGHCVIENAYMLLKQLFEGGYHDDDFLDTLAILVETGKGDRELEGF